MSWVTALDSEEGKQPQEQLSWEPESCKYRSLWEPVKSTVRRDEGYNMGSKRRTGSFEIETVGGSLQPKSERTDV